MENVNSRGTAQEHKRNTRGTAKEQRKGCRYMTLDDIKKLELLQTRSIATDTKDQQTHAYIVNCLQALYKGDYGAIPPEDTEANNAELATGVGRIVARYKANYSLKDDIYIIACFSQEIQSIDANHIMIMYVTEY